jgi:hypothetical protein
MQWDIFDSNQWPHAFITDIQKHWLEKFDRGISIVKQEFAERKNLPGRPYPQRFTGHVDIHRGEMKWFSKWHPDLWLQYRRSADRDPKREDATGIPVRPWNHRR